ncbi:MAG: CBS domain-containing protein [Gammaproteobacteria bacterium]|nr:CBS domain-containing protein [Gammaproteobacteria bacterium]
MYVSQIMSHPVDTTTPSTKLPHAAKVMAEKKRRFLPVVDGNNQLLGLFSHKELARSAPSDITTLSVGEVNYLTSRITIDQVMAKHPVTCSPDTLVEEAGQMMRQHKVGALPVLEQKKLVGIVTEDDILDFLLEITGSNLVDTTRIAIHLPDETGALSQLMKKINEYGGYIATVVSPVSPDETGMRIAIIRYRAENPEKLDDHLEELGYDLITEKLPGQ